MPRPVTKEELIAESQNEYAALENLLATFAVEQMVAPGALGEWSVKDIVAHLYEWQRMFFTWYEAGLRGEIPLMPAEGFKWNQLAGLNQEIFLRYRELPLEEALETFRASHLRMTSLVSSLDAEDLTRPGRFPWTRDHALIGYISANCGNHYRWARTVIKKGLGTAGSSTR